MEWKQVIISILIGILAGITLDELFAGKVVAAIKHELEFIHTKIDMFFERVEKKIDAIMDKLILTK